MVTVGNFRDYPVRARAAVWDMSRIPVDTGLESGTPLPPRDVAARARDAPARPRSPLLQRGRAAAGGGRDDRFPVPVPVPAPLRPGPCPQGMGRQHRARSRPQRLCSHRRERARGLRSGPGLSIAPCRDPGSLCAAPPQAPQPPHGPEPPLTRPVEPGPPPTPGPPPDPRAPPGPPPVPVPPALSTPELAALALALRRRLKALQQRRRRHRARVEAMEALVRSLRGEGGPVGLAPPLPPAAVAIVCPEEEEEEAGAPPIPAEPPPERTPWSSPEQP
ncbi:basic proline-rich protein-like [Lathamus discolor]|uniref:basic proline-rich protein-like n=1 Tax=Lathamus discolor TaxID=678569 RepID=UPI0032B7ECD3